MDSISTSTRSATLRRFAVPWPESEAYQFRVHGPRFMATFKRGGSVPEDGRCENVPW